MTSFQEHCEKRNEAFEKCEHKLEYHEDCKACVEEFKSPSTWEAKYEAVCGEGMYGNTCFSGWTEKAEEIKAFVRTLLAEAERTAVRKCLEEVKEALPKEKKCTVCRGIDDQGDCCCIQIEDALKAVREAIESNEKKE